MKVNLEVGRPPLYRNKTQNDIRVEEGAETGMRTGSYKMQIRSLLVLLRDEHEDRQLEDANSVTRSSSYYCSPNGTFCYDNLIKVLYDISLFHCLSFLLSTNKIINDATNCYANLIQVW